MSKSLSGDYSASTPTTHSTISSPVGFFPGGPSPDSAFPSHNKPINTRLQAAAAAVDTETHYQGGEMTSQRQEPAGPQPIHELTSDLLPQPSEHHLASPSRSYGQPLSDEHPEIAPAVRVAAPNGGAAEGWDPRRSTSLTTRRTNRSLRTNEVGEGASATGAAIAANELPDVDPSPQARVASVDEEPAMQKATISKDGYVLVRKLSKIEKRGAKAEKATLHVALKELEEIQELQTASIKEEAVSHSRHSRALSDAHKAEMDLLAARTANEHGQASLRAAEEVLEASRKHARETSKMLREKMEEVDGLRVHKRVGDKKRAIKVKGPVGQKGNRFGRILGSK